jgi:hypothetical protein
MLDELGRPKTYNHYPNGWAMAFNTPFKMWKRYEFNGGTSHPCIISWPKGVEAKGGEIREQYHHAIDLIPTILDALGVEPPETIAGHVQSHFDGVSMRYSFDSAPLPSARETQSFSMLGSRSIWHDGWKAVTTHPALSGWDAFAKDTWALYHADVDRAEQHDLAAAEPERLQELINLWYAEAGANGAFPLDDRLALEILTTPRPVLSPPRDRYVYSPASPTCPSPRRPTSATAPTPSPRSSTSPPPEPKARCSRTAALRRPRPLRQGQPAALRLQLRRQPRTEDRSHRGAADRRGPDPVRRLREGGRGSARRRGWQLSLFHAT